MARHGGRSGLKTLRFAAIAALGALAVLSLAAPASAENQRPRTIFDLLFRPRESARPEVKKPRVTTKPKKSAKAVRRKPAYAVADAAQAPVEKALDAKIVLVVGDFIAGSLAEGLAEALSANATLRVVDRTNGSSGFVRNDYYDWPAQIVALAATEKPAAIVVMLGANDRQQMKVGATREQPLTEAWTAEYRRRVEAFATAARATGAPVLWVGQPSFKAMTMSNGMIALNDVFRAEAEKSGATWVDIWDGFVDQSGAYAATGPDIAGQPARLRANDGINLTKAGRRKVAFYVEKPLGKLFGTTTLSPSLAALPGAGQPAATATAEPVPALDRSEPIGLDDPALDGSAELLGATPPKPASPQFLQAPSGRADDFSAPAIVGLSPLKPKAGETAAR